MLAAMRKTANSTFAKIFIFGVLILSFGAWGIADYVTGGSTLGTTAAYVGKDEISLQQLSRAYNESLRQANLGAIDPETAQALGLANRALDGLVAQSLVDQEAIGLGLAAPDSAVVRTIQSNPNFRGTTGQFDRAVYQGFLQFSGLTERAYVAAVRQEIARRQLLESMVSGAGAPTTLSKRLYAWRNETRSATYLTVSVDESLDVGAPSESDLTAYFEENKEEFRRPELRAVSYIHLAPTELQAEIEISDEAIEESYQARLAEFTVPERRTLRQMLLPDEETAKAALARIRGGEDFADIAAEVAGAGSDVVELGTMTREQLPDPALQEAAFSLAEGETSEATEGVFGWFLVQATDVIEGSRQSLDEVRDVIRNDLAASKAIEAVYKLSTDLDDQLGGGATLEEAAASLNLKVQKLEAVSQSGRGADDALLDLPDAPVFLATLYETDAGLDSLLVETSDNGYFVLRTDSVTESRIPPLEDIRAAVVDAWRTEQRFVRAKPEAEAAKALLEDGRTVEDVATEKSYNWSSTGLLTREGAGSAPLPSAIRTQLFEGKVGDVFMGRTFDGYAIAVLDVVNEVNMADSDTAEQVNALGRELSRGIGNDLLAQFREALEDEYSVTIKQDVVDQIYFPGGGAN